MATKALITPEQYLATHCEREPEYVYREIVELPSIWVVEPELKKLQVYRGGLLEVAQFELPAHNLTITPADLFE